MTIDSNTLSERQIFAAEVKAVMDASYKEHKIKTQFIEMLNTKFVKCAATGKVLEPSIQGALTFPFSTGADNFEAIKSLVVDYFSDPDAYDVGEACSKLFMGAIESFSTNDSVSDL